MKDLAVKVADLNKCISRTFLLLWARRGVLTGFVFCLFGAVAGSTKQIGTEYFPVDAFLRGFYVTPPAIKHEIPLSAFGRLAPWRPTTSGEPFWTVVQWHCIESLTDAHRQKSGSNEAVWKNSFQQLRLFVDESDRTELQLCVDSLAVYNHLKINYERMAKIRPHLLLSHSFYPDRDNIRRYGGAELADTTPDDCTFPELNNLASLKLSMSLRLVDASDLRESYTVDSPENRRPHYNRVPFQFWFRVYCRNPADPAYGRFFWLGCRVYNNDYLQTRASREQDHIERDGRKTFAYLLSDKNIHGPDYEMKVSELFAGRETAITMDVLDAARKAVLAIQERHKDFMQTPPELAGYTIISFNIGWEPASPFRAAMAIRDLSLYGEHQTEGDQNE